MNENAAGCRHKLRKERPSTRLRDKVIFGLVAAPLLASAAPATASAWVETWAASPDRVGTPMPAQTLRQVVRISAGGKRLRIRLSNAFGTKPLKIGAASVARSAGGSGIEPLDQSRVTFGGRAEVIIPPGVDALSDPVKLRTEAVERIAVSLYLPDGSSAPTQHGVGLETAFMADGDQTALQDLTAPRTNRSRFFLSDVEVMARPGTAAFMVLGDSISDGVGSTFGADARWPDVLAAGLRPSQRRPGLAVANAGISGNRLLNDGAAPYIGPSGISRFSRDILAKPGLRWVLLFQGGNDISAAAVLKTPRDQVSAEQIIAGLQALVAQAHRSGVAVLGATLLPRGRAGEPFNAPANEAKRQQVNAWIRGGCGFDAIVDLDRALRDPAAPERMLPQFDSGDHVHPNDAGHRAIAQTVHGGLMELIGYERTHGSRITRFRRSGPNAARCQGAVGAGAA
jgi:lysophospholipase L1-like esterase